jgi:hypothetical protein
MGCKYDGMDYKEILERFDGKYDHLPLNDNVNRPAHYANKSIEVIDYIKDTLTTEQYQGYCLGNVIKYISRYQKKNGREDLKKAAVYLRWLTESLGER